ALRARQRARLPAPAFRLGARPAAARLDQQDRPRRIAADGRRVRSAAIGALAPRALTRNNGCESRQGRPLMTQTAFENALSARVDAMVDACVRCGKCVEVCPVTGAAGMAEAEPVAVITGVLDILRTGAGPEAARQWANACVLSGECIKACDYG